MLSKNFLIVFKWKAKYFVKLKSLYMFKLHLFVIGSIIIIPIIIQRWWDITRDHKYHVVSRDITNLVARKKHLFQTILFMGKSIV